jgi:hypothetical protein
MRKKTGFKRKTKWKEATNERPSEPRPQDHCDWKSLVKADGLDDHVVESDTQTTGGSHD